MRFNEFRLVEQTQPKFYTIGDSHAESVATAGGKDWVNLAIGGRSSTDGEMLANISKVPKGAVVLVSQGANDTASAARMHIDSKGKRPLKDPKVIASNVKNVVEKVQSQGATVIFMLFPNGPGRGAGLAKYYGGDYQEQVRSAIKSALGDVKIIDINGKPLTDGVHATMGTYKDVANQVKAQSGSGVTLGNPSGTPGAPATKNKGAGTKASTVLSVPQGRTGIEVADVQKALIALGYPLPRHGVDGIRGPETVAAVKKFQTDNGLAVDGDPGPETVAALNKLITTNGITITKSTAKDVKASAPTRREMAPLSQDAVTKGKVGKVLNFIAGPESGGHYDIMMGGKREPAILKMTLNELLEYQRKYKAAGAETAAAGRYQYMPATLRDYGKRMGVDFNKQTFDPKFQDELAIYTMRYQCKLDGWLDGKVSDGEFLNLLAQVWAGIPKTSGLSAYDKVGSNKAGIRADVALNTLQTIRQA